MWWRLRDVEEKKTRLSFPPPWEFQTSIFSLRTPNPSLCLRDPGLFISQPRNWLSHHFTKWFVPLSSLFQEAMDFPGGSDGKVSAYNVEDQGSIPGLGRSPGEGNGNLLHYSCLENPMRWRSLVGYSPWGHKESEVTERLHFFSFFFTFSLLLLLR